MEPPRPAPALDDAEALHTLANPVRRRLYAAITAAGRPLGRDEAAAAAGISRSLAAYHLDKLVELGLLRASFAHGGAPAAVGRPAKLYARAGREFVLRAPPRDYQLLSELMIDAAARDETGVVTTAVERTAYESGRTAGERARTEGAADRATLRTVLERRGYEPFEECDAVRLRNCPFHAVAATDPKFVCKVNLRLLEGIVDGLELRDARAVLDPRDDRCCVAIEQASPQSSARTN